MAGFFFQLDLSEGSDNYSTDGADSPVESDASSLSSSSHSALESDEFSFEDDSCEDGDSNEDSDVVVESSRDILSTLYVVKRMSEHHLNQAIRLCTMW